MCRTIFGCDLGVSWYGFRVYEAGGSEFKSCRDLEFMRFGVQGLFGLGSEFMRFGVGLGL